MAFEKSSFISENFCSKKNEAGYITDIKQETAIVRFTDFECRCKINKIQHLVFPLDIIYNPTILLILASFPFQTKK